MTTLFTGDTMHGAQVELTLDHSMQQAAYNLIPNDARGSIVVTEIETGDVKAMASKPSYDPNELAVHSNSQYTENRSRIIDQVSVDPYSFRPLNSPIFPGSSFKLVTAAAMLESGDYAPDDELDNPPEIDLPDSSNTLPNFRDGGCGAQSQAELNWIFANSCNTPFAEAAMDIGQGTMLETAEAFGFNQPLRIPNHVTASNFPQDDIEDAFLALSSIGQDNVTATPLQMNMAAAAVANDGAMMRPQLVDTIRGSDLQILSQPASEVLNDAMSSSTAADIADMMVETAETGTGAAASAQTSHDIAVKTGTAETGRTAKCTPGSPGSRLPMSRSTRSRWPMSAPATALLLTHSRKLRSDGGRGDEPVRPAVGITMGAVTSSPNGSPSAVWARYGRPTTRSSAAPSPSRSSRRSTPATRRSCAASVPRRVTRPCSITPASPTSTTTASK